MNVLATLKTVFFGSKFLSSPVSSDGTLRCDLESALNGLMPLCRNTPVCFRHRISASPRSSAPTTGRAYRYCPNVYNKKWEGVAGGITWRPPRQDGKYFSGGLCFQTNLF